MDVSDFVGMTVEQAEECLKVHGMDLRYSLLHYHAPGRGEPFIEASGCSRIVRQRTLPDETLELVFSVFRAYPKE